MGVAGRSTPLTDQAYAGGGGHDRTIPDHHLRINRRGIPLGLRSAHFPRRLELLVQQEPVNLARFSSSGAVAEGRKCLGRAASARVLISMTDISFDRIIIAWLPCEQR
jgi:hypothetical protein